MNKILVTGGAGFIGSHLSEALVKRGDKVICYDNFDPYYDLGLKRRNIEWLRRQSPYTLVEGDILDTRALESAISDHGVTRIVHLAARAGVRPSLELPALYQQVNVVGTTNVLEAARKAGINSVVLASSSSVYGGNMKTPFREEDVADYPVSPYAASKRASELMAHTYSHLYQMDTVCLRFFTVYGPRQRPDMAISKFVDRISHGKPIDVYGDGTTRRDYTFVADIVSGVLAALDKSPGLGFQVFNLGNSRTITLRDLIDVIGDTLGRTPELRRLPDQPGDVPQTYACVEKATRLLGYRPQTTVREGIARYVAWVRHSNVALHEPKHELMPANPVFAEAWA